MRLTTTVTLAIVGLLILSSLGLYMYQQAESALTSPDQKSKLLQRINDRERIQFLLIHSRDRKLSLAYLISYESISGRFSAIYLPPETKILSPSYGEVFTLRKLYSSFNRNPRELKRELASALQLNIPYWIHTRKGTLKKLVDHLGGIQIKFPGQSGDASGRTSNRTIHWMDGVQIQDYVTNAYDEFRSQGRRFRHKTFFLGLVRWINDHSHLVEDPRSLDFFTEQFRSNFSRSDLRSIVHVFENLELEKVKFPGTKHLLTKRGGESTLDPKPLKNMLPRPLKQIIKESKPQKVIEVQILNGAGISGLAGIARDKLQPDPRIDVVEIGNADRFNYKTTQIIARSGNPKSAAYLKKVLGKGSVESNPSKKLLVDVTIILGKDLKGMLYE